jgi:hypothetical protein
VHACDRDLDHALPQVAVLRGPALPRVLQELVRLEVATLVPARRPEHDRLLHRARLDRLDQQHTGRPVRQRPPRAVPRPGLLGPSILPTVPTVARVTDIAGARSVPRVCRHSDLLGPDGVTAAPDRG